MRPRPPWLIMTLIASVSVMIGVPALPGGAEARSGDRIARAQVPPTATTAIETLTPAEATATASVTATAAATGTVTATAAPRVSATATPVPPSATATATPAPTSTATPRTPATPDPRGTVLMLPTATPTVLGPIPPCPHDPTRWHGVVERNSGGAIICTYSHEHKDDPRAVDGVFSRLTQEVGYPWLATGHHGAEHHNLFNWSVIKNVPCNAPEEFTESFLSFRNLRLETHTAAVGNGVTHRFHSFLFQGQACHEQDPSYTGKITVGGHLDFGNLVTLNAAGGGTFLALGEPAPDVDPTTPGTGAGIKIHGDPSSSIASVTWYGFNRSEVATSGPHVSVSLGIIREAWGPVDPANPHLPLFTGGYANGSWHEPAHLITIGIPPGLDELDGAVDGYVTYQGYTDRWGTLASGCTSAGLDCVPVSIDHMKIGFHQFRNDTHKIGNKDYDVKVGEQSLITFPN